MNAYPTDKGLGSMDLLVFPGLIPSDVGTGINASIFSNLLIRVMLSVE